MRLSVWSISILGLISQIPQAVANSTAAITTIYVERVDAPVLTKSTTLRTRSHSTMSERATSTAVLASSSASPTMPILQETGSAAALDWQGIGLVAMAGVIGLSML